MSDEKNTEKEMEGHVYDGITELDNPLPGWWLWTFFLTIIFAFIYYIHYEVAGGPTLKQELAAALSEIEKNKPAEPAPSETEESLAAAMGDPGLLTKGASIFAEKCAVCHGKDLQGQVGPNLTDKYWIHGKGTRTDIVKVIREGVADKGMPSWSALLAKEDIYGLTAYILSKKGSNPANAKAAQGNLVE